MPLPVMIHFSLGDFNTTIFSQGEVLFACQDITDMSLCHSAHSLPLTSNSLDVISQPRKHE